MSLQLSIPGISSEPIKPVLPDQYRGPVIRGATAVSFSNNSYELSLQKAQFEDFSIHFFSGNSLKAFKIDRSLNDGLFVWFMLNNGIRNSINSTSKVHLRKSHHLLSYMTAPQGIIKLDDTKEFQSLEILYSRRLLEELSLFIPELKPLINSKKEVIVGKRNFWNRTQYQGNPKSIPLF